MKNILLSLAFTLCFLNAEITAYAQEKKDSAKINAIISKLSLEKSGFENAKSPIMDLSQINEINARIHYLQYLNANTQEGDGDVSQLDLKKSFQEESIETIKKFSVTENCSMLRLQLSGLVESGMITITLIKPNGNKFKSIEIDASSDVNFVQTLLIKKNPIEWTGDWQIKVKAVKAKGDYRLNIMTK